MIMRSLLLPSLLAPWFIEHDREVIDYLNKFVVLIGENLY